MKKKISKNTIIKRTVFIILFTIIFSTILVLFQYGKLPKIYFTILIVAVIIMILSVTIGFSYRNNKLGD